MGEEWAEACLTSINERLGRIDNFLTHDCPEHHNKIEHRMTTVEIRIYIICGLLMLFLKEGPSIVRAIF